MTNICVQVTRKSVSLATVFVVLAFVFPYADVMAADRDLLGVGGGVLGIADTQKVRFASLEYRPAVKLYNISPWIGLEFSDEFFYGAAGVLMDFFLSENTLLTPSFGIGYYPENENVDLGGELQFRTCIELSYQFQNSGRLAIGWSHISNGGIYHSNPGTEILKMVYYIPLGIR